MSSAFSSPTSPFFLQESGECLALILHIQNAYFKISLGTKTHTLKCTENILTYNFSLLLTQSIFYIPDAVLVLFSVKTSKHFSILSPYHVN